MSESALTLSPFIRIGTNGFGLGVLESSSLVRTSHATGLRRAFTALVNSMRCSARLARAHADVNSAGFYAGAGPSAAAAHAAIAEGLGDAPTAYSNHATAAMGWPPRTTDGAAVAAYARLPLCR